MDQSILCSESLELVGSSAEVISSLSFEVFSDLLSKANVRVKASADSSSTLRNLVDILKALGDASLAIAKLVHISRELLTEGQRCGILGVGATNLHNVVELGALGVQDFGECGKLGEQALVDLEHGSDVHDRWERVIAGLRAVYVVIRVHLL